jgi:GTP cyclohydrolase II
MLLTTSFEIEEPTRLVRVHSVCVTGDLLEKPTCVIVAMMSAVFWFVDRNSFKAISGL